MQAGKAFREEATGSILKIKGNGSACVESFFSHLKTVGICRTSVMNKDETIALVEEHIPFYKRERFQKKLGQLSPVEYREKLAA